MSYFEKGVLLLIVLAIFFSYGVYSNIKAISDNNKKINSYAMQEEEQKQRTTTAISFNNDISFMNYNLWLNDCASFANLYLYKNTNSLKILSQKSQEELNTESRNIKLTNGNQSYDKLVKFIIIDKTNKTFITNDTEDIDFIKNNLDSFSKENGELFQYITTKGKWYNISYNSQSSPAAITNKGYLENNLNNNFVEAYWFPKNYTYSSEDYEIFTNIYDDYKANFKDITDSAKNMINYLHSNNTKRFVLIGIYSSLILVTICIMFLLGLLRIKKGIYNSFLVKFFKYMNIKLQGKSTTFKLLFFGLFTSIFSFALLHLLYSIYTFRGVTAIEYDLIIIALYLILILPKFIKFSKYTDEIINGTNIIVSGDLNHVISEKGDLVLSKLASNINKLNKGFKVSIDDQIKNERLKSELVANVSHDLKTPLTSIINYTEILMRNDITEEEKTEYLEILNRKSLKLKKLIEDLFEISKISSGKAELSLEKVDVIELLNQSVAEYSDSDIYLDKNLSFIIKPFAKKIDMNLDGKKISRVFENLIINALKYSLNGTRVIIEISDIEKGIKICFKNTSSTPLDFDNEEIFERFTRGDRARNSEIDGNGLGLAIARSIVELHGGGMHIEFDGDLFKSIIELYY